MSHKWVAIEKWRGRYKCSECKCLGYRKIITQLKYTKGTCDTGDIVVYPCRKKGCRRNAKTWVKRLRAPYCWDHIPKKIKFKIHSPY